MFFRKRQAELPLLQHYKKKHLGVGDGSTAIPTPVMSPPKPAEPFSTPTRRKDRYPRGVVSASSPIVAAAPLPVAPVAKSLANSFGHTAVDEHLVRSLRESVDSLGLVVVGLQEDVNQLLDCVNANLYSINQGVDSLVTNEAFQGLAKLLESLVNIGRAQVLNQLAQLDFRGVKFGYNAVKRSNGVYRVTEEQADNPVDGIYEGAAPGV